MILHGMCVPVAVWQVRLRTAVFWYALCKQPLEIVLHFGILGPVKTIRGNLKCFLQVYAPEHQFTAVIASTSIRNRCWISGQNTRLLWWRKTARFWPHFGAVWRNRRGDFNQISVTWYSSCGSSFTCRVLFMFMFGGSIAETLSKLLHKN